MFEGKIDVKALNEWSSTFKSYVDVKNFNDSKQCGKQGDPIITWGFFWEAMHDKFYPLKYQED
jgi:hypothetical protein